MIGIEDAQNTYEYIDYFKILPMINNWSTDKSFIKNGEKVPSSFTYVSNNNTDWMSVNDLSEWIKDNKDKMSLSR